MPELREQIKLEKPDDVQRHPAPVWVRHFHFSLVAAAVVAASVSANAIRVLQETMSVAEGFTDNEMAILQGPGFAFLIVLGVVPLGFLIDKYIRKRLLLAFVVCGVVGNILTAFTESFALLFLSRGMVGLATSGTIITAYSLLADLYPPEARGRGKAILVLGLSAGASAAWALGGYLLARFQDPDAWRIVLVWLTAPLLLVIALALLSLREPPRLERKIKNPTTKQTFYELWEYRRVIGPLMLGLICLDIAAYAGLPWIAPALARSFDLRPDQVGAIMAPLVMIGMIGPVLGGVLADLCQRRGGPRTTVLVVSALCLISIPSAYFALAPNVEFAIALMVFPGILGGASLAMASTLFSIVVPNELRGLCFALLACAASLFGVALGPVAVSALAGELGGQIEIGRALAYVATIGMASGALAFAWARHSLPGLAPVPALPPSASADLAREGPRV